MSTIGSTFILEGLGETICGSNVYPLARHSRRRIAGVAPAMPFRERVVRAVASLFIARHWRVARGARGAVVQMGDRAAVLFSPAGFAMIGSGLVLATLRLRIRRRTSSRDEQDCGLPGRSLSWTAAAIVVGVALQPRHLLDAPGLSDDEAHGAAAAALQLVHRARRPRHDRGRGRRRVGASGILVNTFELSGAAMAGILVTGRHLLPAHTSVAGRCGRWPTITPRPCRSASPSADLVHRLGGRRPRGVGGRHGVGRKRRAVLLHLLALKALPVLILGGFTSVPGLLSAA